MCSKFGGRSFNHFWFIFRKDIQIHRQTDGRTDGRNPQHRMELFGGSDRAKTGTSGIIGKVVWKFSGECCYIAVIPMLQMLNQCRWWWWWWWWWWCVCSEAAAGASSHLTQHLRVETRPSCEFSLPTGDNGWRWLIVCSNQHLMVHQRSATHTSVLLPPPRRLSLHRRLFVCLLAGLRENYSTEFHKILWKELIRFSSQYESRYG